MFRKLAANGGTIDTQMIDSTHVKAHRSAAGGKRGRKSRLNIAEVDDEIRGIVARNWPYLLEKLPPEDE